ncbi:hypothetical protein B0H13DRAFT_2323552 [Mycena leptocephala]|nr:hypothetical protein B0H13DRAFT_2323552 [Mycena leptocephala]
MPSFTLESGVVFSYTDSGAVTSGGDYTTLVIIHGHTFHSGTFQRLNPLVEPNSLRIISVNRREYPGSSPYSPEELAAFMEGTDSVRASLLEQQGRDLAMFLDGLIKELCIPQTGGVALIGWSMGTLFLLALISLLRRCPPPAKLGFRVLFIPWFFSALGVPNPSNWIMPHTDPDIAPEARGPAFAKWISSYFIHGDLSTRDLDQLTYNSTDPFKLSTVESLKPEELFAIADFAPADKYDSIVGLPPFAGLVFKQTNKALFDSTVRAAWSGTKFWNLYGTAEPRDIIHAAWFLEDQSRAANCPELAINTKAIEGINHFVRPDYSSLSAN